MELTTTPTTRRRALIGIGAATATVALAATASLALAGGAAASAPAQADTSAPVAATQSSMTQVWADTTPATHEVVCTAFQTNPDGTWQVLAQALASEGIDRTEAFGFFAENCPAPSGVANLGG